MPAVVTNVMAAEVVMVLVAMSPEAKAVMPPAVVNPALKVAAKAHAVAEAVATAHVASAAVRRHVNASTWTASQSTPQSTASTRPWPTHPKRKVARSARPALSVASVQSAAHAANARPTAPKAVVANAALSAAAALKGETLKTASPRPMRQ